MNSHTKSSALRVTVIAVFMAMNIALSSFGVPVPGGHLYLNDIIICTAALLLDPSAAFIVGGIGAFIGDLLFYPTPMFVSLLTHGWQAVIISLCSRRLPFARRTTADIVGVSLGAVIMVAGYTFGRAYIYATPEMALLKLPYQIIQAVLGAALSVILVDTLSLRSLFDKRIGKKL